MRRGVALATNLAVLGRISVQLRLSVNEVARLFEKSTLKNSEIILDQYRNAGLTQNSICFLLTSQPSLLSQDGVESVKDLLAAFDALGMSRKTSSALLAKQPICLQQPGIVAIKQRLEFLSKARVHYYHSYVCETRLFCLESHRCSSGAHTGWLSKFAYCVSGGLAETILRVHTLTCVFFCVLVCLLGTWHTLDSPYRKSVIFCINDRLHFPWT